MQLDRQGKRSRMAQNTICRQKRGSDLSWSGDLEGERALVRREVHTFTHKVLTGP
jgi:hypothetical protein